MENIHEKLREVAQLASEGKIAKEMYYITKVKNNLHLELQFIFLIRLISLLFINIHIIIHYACKLLTQRVAFLQAKWQLLCVMFRALMLICI